MNEYLAKVKLTIDQRFSKETDLFLADCPEVIKYCINVNFSPIIILPPY